MGDAIHCHQLVGNDRRASIFSACIQFDAVDKCHIFSNDLVRNVGHITAKRNKLQAQVTLHPRVIHYLRGNHRHDGFTHPKAVVYHFRNMAERGIIAIVLINLVGFVHVNGHTQSIRDHDDHPGITTRRFRNRLHFGADLKFSRNVALHLGGKFLKVHVFIFHKIPPGSLLLP